MTKRIKIAVMAFMVALALVYGTYYATMHTLQIVGAADGNVSIRSALGVDGYVYSTH
jgi:hypothetical protein